MYKLQSLSLSLSLPGAGGVLLRSACRRLFTSAWRAGALRGGAGRRHAGALCGAARALC